jgi:hypothetical protein
MSLSNHIQQHNRNAKPKIKMKNYYLQQKNGNTIETLSIVKAESISEAGTMFIKLKVGLQKSSTRWTKIFAEGFQK